MIAALDARKSTDQHLPDTEKSDAREPSGRRGAE